jgi:hypothetical protein
MFFSFPRDQGSDPIVSSLHNVQVLLAANFMIGPLSFQKLQFKERTTERKRT